MDNTSEVWNSLFIRINSLLSETQMHIRHHERLETQSTELSPDSNNSTLSPISFMSECTLSGWTEGHNLMRERWDRSGNTVLTPHNNHYAKRLRGHTDDIGFSHAAKTIVPISCLFGNICLQQPYGKSYYRPCEKIGVWDCGVSTKI